MTDAADRSTPDIIARTEAIAAEFLSIQLRDGPTAAIRSLAAAYYQAESEAVTLRAQLSQAEGNLEGLRTTHARASFAWELERSMALDKIVEFEETIATLTKRAEQAELGERHYVDTIEELEGTIRQVQETNGELCSTHNGLLADGARWQTRAEAAEAELTTLRAQQQQLQEANARLTKRAEQAELGERHYADQLEAAEASPAALVAPWQPIAALSDEDTEYYLLYSPAHGLVIGAHVCGDVWHFIGVGAVTSQSERPTHCMPLPDPPVTDEGGETLQGK